MGGIMRSITSLRRRDACALIQTPTTHEARRAEVRRLQGMAMAGLSMYNDATIKAIPKAASRIAVFDIEADVCFIVTWGGSQERTS